MKEIDFLPSWYTDDRKRQIGRRTQYIMLGAVFALMMIWNFVTVSSVSSANAQLESLAGQLQDAKSVSQQYSSLQKDVDQLKLKVDTVKMTDSNIDIAATLAEISYLTSDRIALNKITLKSEPLAVENLSKGNAVRSAGNPFKGEEKFGKNRFKIIISGVACDATNVAELIGRLEASPYFCQIIPSYSRNKQITDKASNTSKQYQMSEFEISCYLANYKEKDNQNFAKTGSGQGNL